MEYFSNSGFPIQSTAADDSDDLFALAIQQRFNNPQANALTSHLKTPDAMTMPSTSRHDTIPPNISLQQLALGAPPSIRPVSSQQSSPIPASSFQSISPSSVPSYLSRSKTVLVDIRPPSQYDVGRLSPSVSLSVPSTLLKRPQFTLAKLASMLPSASATNMFLTWNTSETIVVIDGDSLSLPETSNVLGLLRKFRSEQFAGELLWIKGGFAAVYKASQTDSQLGKYVTSSPISKADGPMSGNILPRACDLPQAAFEQASTTKASHRPPSSPFGRPSPQRETNLQTRTTGGAMGPSSKRVMAANPFYDNIRQLAELSHGITERIPLRLPKELRRRSGELPFRWLREIASRQESKGAETMAMQFYKIELAEQRRLMGIMDEHSRQSDGRQRQEFPFSITAGIEKGGKNRYRNIWPFEHSRVHLKGGRSDYVNASFVQPPGTDKRYIATQGPLPETFSDFWMMVWEQNVTAIVMLTKRFEGSSVKCGTYWPVPPQEEMRYGDFIVRIVSASPGASELDAAPPSQGTPSGFDFGEHRGEQTSSKSHHQVARRVFTLYNAQQPRSASRRVHHFQYLDWPDQNVPSSPDGLLDLINEVNVITSEKASGPPLLHCSAGVGRTGGYIVVDAVLDAIRQELRHGLREPSLPQPMDASLSSQESGVEIDASSVEDPPMSELRGTSLSPEGRREVLSIGKNSPIPSPGGVHWAHHPPLKGLTITRSIPQSSSPAPVASLAAQPASLLGDRPWPLSRRTSHDREKVDRMSQQLPQSPMDVDSSHPTPRPSDKPSSPLYQVTNQTARAGSSNAQIDHGRPVLNASLASGPSLLPHSSTHSTPASSVLPSRTGSTPLSSPIASTAFDFTLPRTTVVQGSEVQSDKLADVNEPIRYVLEGMREQRMSLCQTLRQYVFVHLAIIQGSLAVVDELSHRGSEQGDSGSVGDHIIQYANRAAIKRRMRSGSVSPEPHVSRPRKSTTHSSATQPA